MKALETFRVEGLTGVAHIGYIANMVVCCHGLYSTKDGTKHVEFAELVNNRGFSCVRFDFSGCGESKGLFSHSLDDKVYDLSCVIDYIRSEYGPSKIALFGSSFGGMTSLSYAASNPIKSVVAIATPARVMLEGVTSDVQKEVTQVSHVLFMHGKQDELVSSDDSQLLYDKACNPKKIIMYDTDHRFSDKDERTKALLEGALWIAKHF